MKKKWIRLIVALVLSGALVSYLLNLSGPISFKNIGEDFRLEFFFAALGSFICYQILRTMRFRSLIGSPRAGIRQLFSLLCMQGLLNKFIPFWGGEVSLVYLLRRRLDVRYSEGVVVLFLARGIDSIVWAIGLSLFTFLPPWREIGIIWPAAILFGAAGIALIGLVLAVLFRMDALLHMLTGKGRGSLARRLSRTLQRVHASLEKARAVVQTNGLISSLVRCSVWTTLMWTAMYFMFYFLFLSTGSAVAWQDVLFGFFVMWGVNALPIRGFANIGVWEGSWTAIFVAQGMTSAEAVKIAFVSRAGQIAIVVLVGAIPLLRSIFRGFGSPIVPETSPHARATLK